MSHAGLASTVPRRGVSGCCAMATKTAREVCDDGPDPPARGLQLSMGMGAHPIRFRVEQPARMERIHILIRLLILTALGTLAWSSLYWALYIGIPAYAALLISQTSGDRYLARDAPAIVRVIRWISAASAYLWLLTDEFPTTAAANAVELEIDVGGKPTVSSALWRLLYSLPALLIVVVLSLVAGLIWLIGASAILVRRRVPVSVAESLAMLLLYRIRLLGYHLSVVDRYPSFEQAYVAPDLRALRQ